MLKETSAFARGTLCDQDNLSTNFFPSRKQDLNETADHAHTTSLKEYKQQNDVLI